MDTFACENAYKYTYIGNILISAHGLDNLIKTCDTLFHQRIEISQFVTCFLCLSTFITSSVESKFIISFSSSKATMNN